MAASARIIPPVISPCPPDPENLNSQRFILALLPYGCNQFIVLFCVLWSFCAMKLPDDKLAFLLLIRQLIPSNLVDGTILQVCCHINRSTLSVLSSVVGWTG